ncbi:BaeS Signal transduction histidine kinase [Pyrenophora tritici-repentis]|nr:two-component system protein A [Pyrenophora tritici-repentis Pt-1C-BFP]KAA8625872.1 BaeS Signal transduction histidine kinase [Pyrenophora tritici-repentis]EDU40672.1 two-component system protein A [Pyrenophora tritici-repentis Pt-1C-BFP]KAI0584853.1 BaeS Signal transduction histidine kinase [Pyrenophora tritici-repentis]KAI1529326.1 BaeS Signal transduction histidine kinase [Pyrenophora tritici-repentis]KAI1540362.1 BaeS Signal transduction histidine kinase [Pyrenophora tritici-repentis]
MGALLTPPSPKSDHLPPSKSDDDYAPSSLAYDLIRYTPVPTVILDASLFVRHVSDSYVNISGAGDCNSLVGRHADDVFDGNVTIPAFTSACLTVRAAKATGKSQHRKIVTGKGAAWNLRAVPILRYGNLRCIQMEFLDVTEEHQRQLEFEERSYQNETVQLLVATIRDYAIFMLDPGGHVATWNAGAQASKGYTPAEIIGKHFSTFYSQEDRVRGKPERELKDALRDGRCEDEGWRLRKDGSRFWANVVITPVYKDNILLGYSKVTRDLTERRKAENSLIAAYEEASKLKSEFLANMSHEIRTPMHGMLSALTLLLDTKLDDNQCELARIIQESGDVLLQLIDDILDFSKLASGSFSISQDIISVREIIQSVFRVHQACNKPEVKLESFLDDKLPRSAEGDPLRYRQIIQNLLSNATKFTENGYVRIVARLHNEDHEQFTILTEVIDSGIGVPASGAHTLFTPFTQFDNSATKRYKGTGLGLNICKSLAELMGGQIGFRPNPEGRGSIFWFTAKLKKCKQLKALEVLQENMARQKIPSPAPIDPIDTIRMAAANKRLLLVEDNMINRKVMLKMLAGLGFDNMDTAVNGKEAVMKALQEPGYDLVLMDVNMPVQDGVSATKELRQKGLQAPIVAMTANALKGQAESYIAKGMTGYIAKPVDRSLLVKLLLSCLLPKPGT